MNLANGFFVKKGEGWQQERAVVNYIMYIMHLFVT